MSEGGEARNHEAEIEAVAKALHDDVNEYPWSLAYESSREPYRQTARRAIAALDAVRRSPLMAPDPDVSGADDYEGEGGPQKLRSPQGEDRSAGRWCAICGEHGGHHTDRHPQGEDHEAGIDPDALQAAHAAGFVEFSGPIESPYPRLRRAIAVYLSRCPSDASKEE